MQSSTGCCFFAGWPGVISLDFESTKVTCVLQLGILACWRLCPTEEQMQDQSALAIWILKDAELVRRMPSSFARPMHRTAARSDSHHPARTQQHIPRVSLLSFMRRGALEMYVASYLLAYQNRSQRYANAAQHRRAFVALSAMRHLHHPEGETSRPCVNTA